MTNWNLEHKYQIILSILALVLGLIVSFILSRVQKKRKLKHLWTYPIASLYGAIWLTVGLAIITITVPQIHTKHLFENHLFLITPLRISLIIYTIFITTFFARLINWHFKNQTTQTHKKLLLLINLMLWILALSFVIREITKNPKAIFDTTILIISKVKITISDILSIFLILTVTAITTISLKIFFTKQIEKKKLQQGTAVAIFKLLSYVIWTIAIIISLQAIGFNLSIIIAGSAALLVGLGMGIQQLFNDFVSGIVLLTEQKIKVGDIVEVNGIIGKITDINYRTTIITTRDNIRIIVPNSKFTNNNVINWTLNEEISRFTVTVGVAYGSDVNLVMSLLKQIALEHPKVRNQPEPYVLFEEFADSSLNFTLYFFTDKIIEVEQIKSDLRVKINEAFTKHNISIPFPQHDVHLFSENLKLNS